VISYHIIIIKHFFIKSYHHHLYLHSFPTRRSSDLGETAETIQHCDEDPAILLTFLDGFVDLAQMNQRDEELRELLLTNQTLIERSEEHTSELQSRSDLVCRLLLEKKKKNKVKKLKL